MHTVYLHFFVDLLFVMTAMFSEFLVKVIGESTVVRLLLPIVVIACTIFLTKDIFTVTFKILLQALPIEDEKTLLNLTNKVKAVSGVEEILDVKFWGMTANSLVCDMKLQASARSDVDELQVIVKDILEENFANVTLEITRSEKKQPHAHSHSKA